MKVLRQHFGKRRLRGITYNQIELFRARRLATPVEFRNKAGAITTTRPRTITAVNRELQLLRAMLYVAKRERWLDDNPFTHGAGLIDIEAEQMREVLITPEQEAHALAFCEDDRRRHLRPILLCALDTGLRFGEIRRMTWRQVDFETGVINILSTHTKRQRARVVGLSRRLADELRYWRANTVATDDDLVFGITTSVKTAWRTVRKLAGIESARLHDLRHTYATRIERSGLVSTKQLGRLLGHTNPKTTYRYVNQDAEIVQRAAQVLDAQHDGVAAQFIVSITRLWLAQPWLALLPILQPRPPGQRRRWAKVGEGKPAGGPLKQRAAKRGEAPRKDVLSKKSERPVF